MLLGPFLRFSFEKVLIFLFRYIYGLDVTRRISSAPHILALCFTNWSFFSLKLYGNHESLCLKK